MELEINTKFDNPYTVRCIVVGNHNVGKSTMTKVYEIGKFDNTIESTIGMSFVSKTLYLSNYNNHEIKLQIWDTAGQEKFKSIVKQYLRDAYISYIVFDITDRESWEAVDDWKNTILTDKKYNSIPQIVLVGTKADLSYNIQVYPEEIVKKAKEWNCKYHIISSKFTNASHTINRMFMLSVEDLHRKLLEDDANKVPIPPKIYKNLLDKYYNINTIQPDSCCNIL
jgi:small GTP-binding protein